MKSLISLLVFTLSSPAIAITKTRFFGLQAMIQIIATAPTGEQDLDGAEIYQAMNVPVENSIMGPGKAIITNDRVLNFICAYRNSSMYECSIVLQRSAQSAIDPFNKTIRYETHGPDANELRKKFYLKQGKYQFRSQDGLFAFEAVEDRFTLIYSASGVNL